MTPKIKRILLLYSNMCPGMTVKDLCLRFSPNEHGIDEQRLVRFGLMSGIIRRIQKYPIFLESRKSAMSSKNMLYYFNGKNSCKHHSLFFVVCWKLIPPLILLLDDEISCELHRSYTEIDEKVEKNASILICWK